MSHSEHPLVRATMQTRSEEIDCDGALELASAFVEQPNAVRFTALRYHLSLCPECQEEVNALLELRAEGVI